MEKSGKMDCWPAFFLLIMVIPLTLSGRPHQMNPYNSNPLITGPVILEIPDELERLGPEELKTSTTEQPKVDQTKSEVQVDGPKVADIESTTTEAAVRANLTKTKPKGSAIPKTSPQAQQQTDDNPTTTKRSGSSKLPTFPPHTKQSTRRPVQDIKRDINEELFDGFLNPVQRMEVQEDAFQSRGRSRRATTIFHARPNQNLGLQDMKTTIAVDVRPYGKCRVGDYENNRKSCKDGETCLATISFEISTECTADDSGSKKCKSCDPACVPSTADTPGTCGPVPPCPSGCELPEPWTATSPTDPGICDMSKYPLDGICVDSSFGTDQYLDATETTTAVQTPMAYYSGNLVKDESCKSYPDAIDNLQKSNRNFGDKLQALRQEPETTFGSEICNWVKARLECIPSSNVRPTLPPTNAPGGPGPGTGPVDESYTSEIWDAYRRREGTCQCILGLGQKALYLLDENPNDRDYTPKCYIPAGKGHHSNCEHDVLLPQGLMEYYNRNEMRIFNRPILAPASEMCVPNAECKPGYKYVGVRCSCKRGYKLDPRNGTCADAVRLVAGRNKWEVYAKYFIIMLGWFYLNKYFSFY